MLTCATLDEEGTGLGSHLTVLVGVHIEPFVEDLGGFLCKFAVGVDKRGIRYLLFNVNLNSIELLIWSEVQLC
jgi:hypothetical protein